MTIKVEAPYFDNPKPPGGVRGQSFYQLWDYEVVEAFFLDSKSQKYLEIELGPHGQYLVMMNKILFKTCWTIWGTFRYFNLRDQETVSNMV